MTLFRRDRGSALPLVLWLLAVLMVIVLTFTMLVQSRLRQVEALWERLEARVEGYSAVQVGLQVLLVGRYEVNAFRLAEGPGGTEGPRFSLDGTPAPVPIVSTRAVLSIQSDQGIVDVRGPSLLLDGLLRRFGLGEENRRVFLDSLRDWMDADDLVRLNGAEKDYYSQLGYRPGNRALITVDEVMFIKGMAEPVYRKIRPYLTCGTTMGFNPNVAPFDVLMALPGMTEKAAGDILAFRRGRPVFSAGMLGAVTGLDFSAISDLLVFSPGITYALEAAVPLAGGSRYLIRCKAEMSLGTTRQTGSLDMDSAVVSLEPWAPFEIEYWKEGIE